MKELNTIQTRLVAQKTQFNSFGKYKYRSCEDILAAVKPLLSETGCTLMLADDIMMVGNRFYVKATATLTNPKGESVTTTAFAREDEEKKGMDGSQVTGASSSYARKYALNGLFAIDDTADADYLNTNKEFTEKPEDKQKAKAKKASAVPTLQEQIKQAMNEIAAAQSRDDLVAVCAKYPQLRTNTEFLAAGTAKKKDLNIQ